MLGKMKKALLAFHRDENGADMIEYILIVAAVALPLVAIMIWFKDDISQWAAEKWQDAKDGQGVDPGGGAAPLP